MQTAAVFECTVPDGVKTALKNQLFQRGTVVEGVVADGVHTFGDCNAPQGGEVGKGITADFTDRQSVPLRRNSEISGIAGALCQHGAAPCLLKNKRFHENDQVLSCTMIDIILPRGRRLRH